MYFSWWWGSSSFECESWLWIFHPGTCLESDNFGYLQFVKTACQLWPKSKLFGSFVEKSALFCFCFDLPKLGHSTADFYQNSARFLNKSRNLYDFFPFLKICILFHITLLIYRPIYEAKIPQIQQENPESH